MTISSISRQTLGSRRLLLTFAGLILLLAVIWGATGRIITTERQKTLDDATFQGTRLATFFESHAASTLQYADDYIKSIRRIYLREGSLSAVREYMAEIPPNNTILSHITIMNSDGVPILISTGNKEKKISPGTHARDRDYFKAQKTSKTDAPFISTARKGRNTGLVTIRLVRRISRPAGEFDGVIFAAIKASQLLDFFKTTRLGPNSTASLVGLDKRIRLRSSQSGLSGTGKTIEKSKLWENLKTQPEGNYQQTSIIDGTARVWIYRTLSDYPIVAVIGVAVPDALKEFAEFEQNAYRLAALISLIVIALTILGIRETVAARLSKEFAEQTRREEALRIQEGRLRIILESSPVGVSLISLQDNKRFYGNPRLIEMFGSESEEQLLTFPIEESYVEYRDYQSVREMSDEDLAKPTEVLRRRIDGSTWWCTVNRQKIKYDGKDCLIVWYYDITDRKIAEDRFRSFVSSASDWYWEMDEDLRFSYFSDSFFDIIGVDPSLLLGKTRQETGIPGVDPTAWKQHLSDLAARRPFRNFVHPRTLPNGHIVWASINGRPVFDENGKFRGYRGTGSDVTAMKTAEENLLKAKVQADAGNRAKTEFMATMNHELRTPLTSIIGSLSLLNSMAPDDTTKEENELLDVALRNGKSMLLLVNELLDYEKILSGTLTIETSRHDICALTSRVVKDNRGYASAHSVNFVFEEPDRPIFADVQEHRFEQVLRNLLSNSAKFSYPNSDVEIGVFDEKGKVIISVKDYGPGIPEDFKNKIFEQFTQIDSSSTRAKSGTGLGLPISKALTEGMGGTLDFDSQLNVGTTFYIRLSKSTD